MSAPFSEEIDMTRDYWSEYYALHNRVFYGSEKIPADKIRWLRDMAELKTRIIGRNCAALGISHWTQI